MFLFYEEGYLQVAIFFLLVVNNFRISNFLYDKGLKKLLDANEYWIDTTLTSIEYWAGKGKDFAVTHTSFLAKNFITNSVYPFLIKMIAYKKPEEVPKPKSPASKPSRPEIHREEMPFRPSDTIEEEDD